MYGLLCYCIRILICYCKIMVQQEGKTKKPVLLDSNEKEDDLLLIQSNAASTAPPPPLYDGAAVLSLPAPESQTQVRPHPYLPTPVRSRNRNGLPLSYCVLIRVLSLARELPKLRWGNIC